MEKGRLCLCSATEKVTGRGGTLHNPVLASYASMFEVMRNFRKYYLQTETENFGANCQRDADETTEEFAAYKLQDIKTCKSIWKLRIYAAIS